MHVVAHATLPSPEADGKEVRQDLVAYVRLTGGAGVVQLVSGDQVPAEADPDHVAKLLAQGVLEEVPDADATPVPAGASTDATVDSEGNGAGGKPGRRNRSTPRTDAGTVPEPTADAGE